MNVILPLLILSILACGSGFLLRIWIASEFLRAVAAAALATALWIGGCYLLFLLTAPSELGPPLLAPLLYAFLTALVPSVVTVTLQHGLEKRHTPSRQDVA